MKINSILKSNHDLKKNGYKIIWKLHKMEKRHGAMQAYEAALEDTYFFIAGCRALIDIINIEYGEISDFLDKSESFLAYLNKIALKKQKIDKRKLSSYLKTYTNFFNTLIDQKVKFEFTPKIAELWNQKCLMAYIATWGKNY